MSFDIQYIVDISTIYPDTFIHANDEPMEDVDPIAPDVVMDIPKGGQGGRVGPQFQMTILSTCKNMSIM